MSFVNDHYTISDLIDKVSLYIKDENEKNVIKKAYDFAYSKHFGQQRLTGDSYIYHPLNVAIILTEVYADYETLATALLHDVINFADATYDEVNKEFGSEIESLLKEISRINKLSLSADNDALASYHKKILVGLSKDVRVIILKIADRLHNMRTLWALPLNKQREKAKETLEILVPIAHRLGINHIKGELEDLCLKYYKPDVYNDILEKLSISRQELDESVNTMMQNVSKILSDNNIKHEMKGRTKSVYSIYSKLNKGKSFNEIYDILALRFFVNTVSECYLALGLIHAKYKPVPRRFKDYIARPKTNGYQSLHTTVFGVDGKLFEIQIRTYQMDKIAEYGFASHWSYKENNKNTNDFMEEKLKSFRSIIELNEQQVDKEEFVNTVKNEIFNSNVIYVYTPKGDVFELPYGSTSVDFAYRVHTSVGNMMTSAIVNNTIMPLDYKLQNNDIVRIITNKNSKGPSKNWLKFAYTSSAKNKIKAFFSKIDKQKAIKDGKELLNKNLRKNKIPYNDFFSEENLNKIYEEFSLKNEDELYYNLGISKLNVTSLIRFVYKENNKNEQMISKMVNYLAKDENKSKGDVVVDGLTDLKVSYAKCCYPVKGDKIIGYISKGNGITVHRSNCHNICNLTDRTIKINWNENSNDKFLSNIIVHTNKKDELLMDLLTKLSSYKIVIKRVDTLTTNLYNAFDMDILVSDKENLDYYINLIEKISYVLSVERGMK